MFVPSLKSLHCKSEDPREEHSCSTREECQLAIGHICSAQNLEMEGFFSKDSVCNVFQQLNINGQLAS